MSFWLRSPTDWPSNPPTHTHTISRKLLTGHMTKILQYLWNKLHLWFSTILAVVAVPSAAAANCMQCNCVHVMYVMHWYISDDGCNYSCYNYTETSAQNTKSHMEMYPNSYNDTMTGETVSCGSEKTDSYSNDGSTHHPDFIVSCFYLFFCLPFIYGRD